ncbi:hypothetical protein N2152v2_001104 [Parachlorella kessleri]
MGIAVAAIPDPGAPAGAATAAKTANEGTTSLAEVDNTPAGATRRPKPSGHYPPIEPPIGFIIARATANRPAAVPRRGEQRVVSSRTLEPLDTYPLGPGRAQVLGELENSRTVYVGEVLAGQPHGQGREYLKGVTALNEVGCFLAYEGDWHKGRKTGMGTLHSLSGEVYTGKAVAGRFNMLSAGQLVDGQRQGFGRQNYFNKDCYEGGWQLGVRSGVGRLRSAANGQIFVGQYVANKREGPGTLYMLAQGKKFLAEFVDDRPKCGVWDDITAEELAAITKHDAQDMISCMAASKRSLPALELDCPHQVLASSLVDVRRQRKEAAVNGGIVRQEQARSAATSRVAENVQTPLTATQIQAVQLAAAWEAAGSGTSQGHTVLDRQQLRRIQERLRTVLGTDQSREICDLLETFLGGAGITYDRLMAAVCGLEGASEQSAQGAAPQGAQIAYPQMTVGQFGQLQTLAMSQLLQAATSAHTESLDGLKAALQGNAALQPDAKRAKVEGEQAAGLPQELAVGADQSYGEQLAQYAPMQLLGLPTHPIITSLALPIGGQLQLNGALLQQQPHEGDDSGEDGTQDDGDKMPDDRANATKEKNRKAQQRFRQRQKEKMTRLEAEVEQLRRALQEKGGDPNSMLKTDQGGWSDGKVKNYRMVVDDDLAGGAQQQRPSVDEMYEQLEQMLDQCPEVHSLTAITFLQTWLNKMPDDTRRLHYKAIKKRFDGNLKEDVKMWVQQALQP